MKYVTLLEAIQEARRFIKAADRVRKNETFPEVCQAGERVAGAKRASLDLSKKLASMRRGR